MARRFIRPRLVDLSGNVLRGGWLRVLDPDTAAEVEVFAASAGGAPLTQPLTTDVRGEVECWLDAGTSVDLEWSDSGATKVAATGRTVAFDTFTEFVDADPVVVASTTHAALTDLATSGHPASVISGLGGAALLDVGTTAGTVAAGDDSRFTDARTPSAAYLVDALEFVIDGGGSALTTGMKGYLEVPYACTITRATLLADQSGSVVVDIFRSTYSDFAPPTHPVSGDKLTASAPPTISTATKSQDATLTGWTTSLAAGDVLAFNVNSATTITRVTCSLKVTRT